jgi:hypothetical protein
LSIATPAAAESRGLDDTPEHGLELQVAADRDNGLQQAMHPVPRVHDGLQTSLQLGKQVIEPQLRQYRVRLCRLHQASPAAGLGHTRELIVWQRVHRAYARLLRFLAPPTGSPGRPFARILILEVCAVSRSKAQGA